MKIEKADHFFKVDDAAGIAYGWAIVCTEGGSDYFDLQGDHIPEDVMVEAAADFASNSRVGKDMHAGDKVGDVLFTWPVTKESAAGLGFPTTKTGLLIGFRPHDPELLALVKSGARTGFSIGGVVTDHDGLAKFAKAAGDNAGPRRTFRSFRIHEISLVDRPAQEGALVGYVKRAPQIIAKRDEEVASSGSGGGGSIAIVLDEEALREQLRTPMGARVLQEALARKSTPSPASPNLNLGDINMNELDTLKQQLSDLTKRAERAERIAKMSGAHKAHYDALSADDQELFLAKSTADRATEVTKSLDEDKPIWTGEVTKVAVRKRDGELALQLAKQNEANAIQLAKREDEIEKAEVRAIAKSHLGALTGDDDTHDLIVKALRKSGADQAAVDKALTAMKGWNAVAASKSRAAGAGGDDLPAGGSIDDQLETLAKKLAAENKISFAKAFQQVMASDEGKELYNARPAARLVE